MKEVKFNDVAVLTLNTQALGVQHNLERILEAAKKAAADGKSALFCSELCVTGPECDDMFLSMDFFYKTQQLVRDFQKELPPDFVVGLGMPQCIASKSFPEPYSLEDYASRNQKCKDESERCALHTELKRKHFFLGNAYVLLTRDEVLFTAPSKVSAAGDMTDYSSRFFSQASPELGFDVVQSYVATVGDKKIILAFGDANAFAENEELKAFAQSHKDELAFIAMCGSYGYEVGAPEAARASAAKLAFCFGLPVVMVNNLGCTAGGTIYDGQCLFMEESAKVVASTPLLSFSDSKLLYSEGGVASEVGSYDLMLKAVSLGLFDWMKKTHSKGFALSLSGGADSALCATCVALSQIYAFLELGVDAYISVLKSLKIELDYEGFASEVVKLAGHGPYGAEVKGEVVDALISCLKRYVMPNVLVCAYQGSDYSGSVTRTAATKMAEAVGATFYQWSIAPMVKDYVTTLNQALGYELTWEHDDIALQNIQARSRLPSIWLLANHKGFLLLATSNLSEASVGYCTMDGDTAGGLSPIAGIDKSTILRINRSIMENGIQLGAQGHSFKVPNMSYIVAQAPTAELRPGGEQTDEKDLMPYPLLDTIRRLFTVEYCLPERIVDILDQGKDDKFHDVTVALGVKSREDIERCVRRFFALFQRNQWKRERYATGFHIMHDDASPRSYLRFPVLSAPLY